MLRVFLLLHSVSEFINYSIGGHLHCNYYFPPKTNNAAVNEYSCEFAVGLFLGYHTWM